MAGVGQEKPLQKIVAAFKPLADVASSGGGDMEVGPFAHACAEVSVLFGYVVGHSFMIYAETDYSSKVNDLIEASKSISTLKDMIELDIQQNRARRKGSHTRNLLRVNRVLDMIRVLFEEITNSDGNIPLRAAAVAAYIKVFAAHHHEAILQMVANSMYELLSMSEFLVRLSGDEASAKIDMQSFIRTCAPVIQYVQELFNATKLGTDW